jgi:hypothetical protein
MDGFLADFASAPRSLLFTSRDNFNNFHLRLEVRLRKIDDSSGVWFRYPSNGNQGYSVMIGARRSGAIWRRASTSKGDWIANGIEQAVGQWIAIALIAEGNRLKVVVNGKTTADVVDEKAVSRSGHLVLDISKQSVEFRKIELKELPVIGPDLEVQKAGTEGVARPFAVQGRKVAHFRFNGTARDRSVGNAQFDLKHTEFKENALYLNGTYYLLNDAAICKTPQLNYRSFTVALKFKAEEFHPGRLSHASNIFTGGTYFRWFGLNRSPAGNLTITLNNREFSHEIKETPLVKGRWTAVACGVDLSRRKVIVYLDGKKVDEIGLPQGFQLEVLKSNLKDQDKVWSFTNYGNGDTFHGLVSELIIFDGMLPGAEFAKIR